MRKFHLLTSAMLIIIVALLYGGNPNRVLPLVFDFKVESLELKNIFRAIMGLYLGFAFFWALGAANNTYWKAATLSNIIFMGGLALGRLLSFVLDGISYQYVPGVILEVIFMILGIYNLKKTEVG
ncbi:DUF4345 domain-containing protein [Tenacibaculum sp. S7007]|uniref:DUF4345 domain-containing protein n=1 Tax=Tenacibaculum pelagium TaxID=2759527 RepID=A0A839ANK0_9FLAO|nr:DUF4345 domain-containing protein [Tenacibaculum pelagium]MBA6155940.1 DUF4345 domain-containing protein [Tenacibaculum pelagium]